MEVNKWKKNCEDLSVPHGVPDLEEAIHQNQQLIESITQAYTEVWIVK